MPICIKCSHENPEGRRLCEKCGAILPMPAPEGLPESGLNLGELMELPPLETHYNHPILVALAWSAEALIEGEGPIDDVVLAYEGFIELFDNTVTTFPQAKEVFYSQRQFLDTHDPFPDQLNFLIHKAEEVYAQAKEKMEGFLVSYEEDEADADELTGAIQLLLDANDNVCMTLELLQGRIDGFEEAINEKIVECEKRGWYKDGKPVPDGDEVAAPVDSSDVS